MAAACIIGVLISTVPRACSEKRGFNYAPLRASFAGQCGGAQSSLALGGKGGFHPHLTLSASSKVKRSILWREQIQLSWLSSVPASLGVATGPAVLEKVQEFWLSGMNGSSAAEGTDCGNLPDLDPLNKRLEQLGNSHPVLNFCL
ncbi:uncharacterized protein C2845_PM01G38300 [Panicum miliaceum]|uniref:Uncharacterized protein n=1 Tax=Panicum miliaceum TaxID=4540 RepID=A0A3L6TKF2_PANMI|nr:uncharacterized protein C2845_PM01G38300 [Panicum miliaceum]